MSGSEHDHPQFQLALDQVPDPSSPPSDAATSRINPASAVTDDNTFDELLQVWQQGGWIRPLDVSFARLIGELCREQGSPASPLALLLAALTSHQVGRGHVCIDLTQLLADADNTLSLPPQDSADDGLSPAQKAVLIGLHPNALMATVSLNDCLAALNGCVAVSDGRDTSPLVRVSNRLYLRRYWRYEQRIADGIRQRLSLPSPLADAASPAAHTLAQALNVLFEGKEGLDYQKFACALAARQRFAVITGGPGTGKTSTVVRLLAALQSVASQLPDRNGRPFRIRLAAPTGKAAARLNESIGAAVNTLPLTALPGRVAPADIPTKVITLHRLLGSRPDSRRFRHHQDNPLPLDILVIDEASMVDVDLMASVFDALPPSAQLILLGDKDQLASVDAGAVLGELCQRAAAGHYHPDVRQWLQQLTEQVLPDTLVDMQGHALDQAVAMLRKSYRFSAGSGIKALADAVNHGAFDSQMQANCRELYYDDVAWLDIGDEKRGLDGMLNALSQHALNGSPQAFKNKGQGRLDARGNAMEPPTGFKHYLTVLQQHPLTIDDTLDRCDEVARQVLRAFSQFQLLCALRKGPWGVDGLNQRIARALSVAGLIDQADGWYAGRPVLITANDYNLGLMNGDIGITMRVPMDKDADGKPALTLRVAFPSSDGSDTIRWISPSRLQQLETVYAMTVHKSQGSEFTHACLVLPDNLSPVVTKELIYTGITRAKNWFSLVAGSPVVMINGSQRGVVRVSGLIELLDEHYQRLT